MEEKHRGSHENVVAVHHHPFVLHLNARHEEEGKEDKGEHAILYLCEGGLIERNLPPGLTIMLSCREEVGLG
jgi:hypothetical protein